MFVDGPHLPIKQQILLLTHSLCMGYLVVGNVEMAGMSLRILQTSYTAYVSVISVALYDNWHSW